MMTPKSVFYGTVRVFIEGRDPERLLNLCARNGIGLRKLKSEKKGISFTIDLSDLEVLKTLSTKTDCQIDVMERKGINILIKRFLKRKVFAVCMVLAFLFWGLSYQCIWDIRILGNQVLTKESLEEFLKEQGIHRGIMTKKVYAEKLEKSLRDSFENITWVNVRQDGMLLWINLKEKEEDLIAVEKKEDCTDLISPYDGIIVSILTRAGIPKVTKGQEVTKGSVLVEGKVPVFQEDGQIKELLWVRADADIVIEHVIPYCVVLAKNYVTRDYTGRENKKWILSFGNQTHSFLLRELSFHKQDIITITQNDFGFLNWNLPMKMETQVSREYQETLHRYTQDETKRIFLEKFHAIIRSLQEKGVQILQKNVKIETYGDYWEMHIELTVQERFGQEAQVADDIWETMYLEETE